MGKVIVITGGARGIGKKILEKFAYSGDRVIFLDNNKELGEQTKKEFKEQGVEFYPFDLLKFDEIKEVVSDIKKRYQTIDVLVNNAKAGNRKELLQEDGMNWDLTVDVILKASFFLTREVVLHMRQQGKGAIVNIGSILGTCVGDESPSYHIAKGGLIQMTRYFAKHAGQRIRTNIILPGFIIQEDQKKRYFSEGNQEYRSIAEACHPVGHTGSCSDVAELAFFLSSDAASFINGESFYLDGGLMIQDPSRVAYNFSKKS